MKNKKVLKSTSLLLAIILMMFSFSSCGFKPEPPDEKAFSLIMDYAPVTLEVGDKITYKAILKNAEHESYTLEHAADIIHIYVVKPENYMDPEAHMALSDAVVSESEIAPHGQIEAFCEFRPTEKGEYILKAYTSFSIEGSKTTKSYFYECDEIKITVK